MLRRRPGWLMVPSRLVLACGSDVAGGGEASAPPAATGTEGSPTADGSPLGASVDDWTALPPRCTFAASGDSADGTRRRLDAGAVVEAIPTSSANYDVVRFNGASRANGVGGTIVGERGVHTGTGGDRGMCLGIDSEPNAGEAVNDAVLSSGTLST